MKSKVKILYYFGADTEFFKNLNICCEKYIRSDFKLGPLEYQPGAIVKLLEDNYPNIVYIDFTSFDEEEQIIEEIIFLKKYRKYKSILFVGILGDTASSKNYRHFFSSGFQLAFIKGGELEYFICDSLYVGFGEKLPMPKYAKAKNIDKTLPIGICSTLSKISLEKFYIETDFESSEGELFFKLPMFEDLEADSFKIKSHRAVSLRYPMMDCYTVDYPYIGPWDEISNKTIQKETVETWFDINKDSLMIKYTFIKVVSKTSSLLPSLFESVFSSQLSIEFHETIDLDYEQADLKLKTPQLIYFDIDDEKDSENNVEMLSTIVNAIKSIEGYAPIIIVTNNPSKSDALKKVYNYPNIVCIQDKLTIDIFNIFTKSYLDKNLPITSEGSFYFKNSTALRATDINLNVTITSLTEHELTFISSTDHPMFSIIHLLLPVECYVTIVPAYIDLPASTLGKHYQGIIHSISEQDKKSLRRFVNQIIYKPISEFTPEAVKLVLEHKEVEQARKNAEKKLKAEMAKIEPVVENTEERFVRPKIQGKSKL